MKKYAFFLLAISLLLSSLSQAAIPPTSSQPAIANEQIEESIAALKNMSKKERKEKSMEIKKAVRSYKSQLKDDDDVDTNKVLALVFAVLIPPIGVVIYENKVTTKFWLSLLLTLLFYLPGMIYSLLVVTGNA
jgi:uncharacterized membrane protein YqaE (UPF0057 family)